MKISKQSGIGLIEVLVTLLILSTSLLALAALQARSLQYNHSSFLRSQANIYAYDILDRIRLNRGELGNYNIAPAAYVSGGPVISPIYARDIDDWRRNIANYFANGKGGIECVSATEVCTVTIIWDEVNRSGGTSEDQTTFKYTTRI